MERGYCMKKIVVLFAAVLAIICNAPAYGQDAASGKTLILYYSKTGIGRAIACILAENCYDVVCVDRIKNRH